MCFVKLMIDNKESGIFHPQNREYVSSVNLVDTIAKLEHHKIWFTKLFNPIIKLFCKQVKINKVFGNLTIDKELSKYKQEYNVYSFIESIK